VADRFLKRRVLLATVSTLGLCAATLSVLCLTGTVQLWDVLAVAFVTGTAAAFDNPTRQAFVHELVGGIRLRNAVSLNAAVSQLGMMVGPALGAALMATLGIGASFACSAGTYVVVAISFGLIRRSQLHETPVLGRGRGQVRSALAEIGRRTDILWPLVLAGFGGFFITNFPVSLAAFTKEFGTGAGGLGFMTSSLAVGSVIGALISARWPGSRLRGLVALTAGIAAAQILAGLMPGIVALCSALVVAGFAASPFRIASNTAVQLAASDAMRGRVMGVFMLLVLGTAAAGGPVVGFVDEHLGAATGFLAGGAVMMLVALLVAGRLSRVSGKPLRPEVRMEASRIRNRLAAVTGR
jgi:MFS family permease